MNVWAQLVVVSVVWETLIEANIDQVLWAMHK